MTITRDSRGHRVSVVANPDHMITGDWEDDRLIRASTRTLHEGEMVEAKSLVRTYDEHGRLTRSVVVDRRLGSPDALPRRSEMRVTYTGCDPSAEVAIEPEHLSPLESPFELLE